MKYPKSSLTSLVWIALIQWIILIYAIILRDWFLLAVVYVMNSNVRININYEGTEED